MPDGNSLPSGALIVWWPDGSALVECYPDPVALSPEQTSALMQRIPSAGLSGARCAGAAR
jgi:hypothetical protein